jgi:hypothetical protein
MRAACRRVGDDLEFRARQLQPARAPLLHLAVEHDALVPPDHVFEEGLIGPHGLNLAARILDERGKETKTGTSSGGEAGLQHVPRHRDDLARS